MLTKQQRTALKRAFTRAGKPLPLSEAVAAANADKKNALPLDHALAHAYIIKKVYAQTGEASWMLYDDGRIGFTPLHRRMHATKAQLERLLDTA